MQIEQQQEDNDSSFEEQKPETYEFYCQLDIQGAQLPLKADRIFIALFGSGSIYLSQKIAQQSDKIGSLSQINHKKLISATIHQIKGANIYCIIFSKEIKEHLDQNFADQILKTYFSTNQFIVLDSATKQAMELDTNTDQNQTGQEQQQSSNEINNLRTINTTKSKQSNALQICQQLEIGKAITGIGADVIQYAEMLNLQADLFLNLSTNYELTLEDVQQFEKIQARYSFLRKETNENDFKQAIKKYNKQKFSNNLYL